MNDQVTYERCEPLLTIRKVKIRSVMRLHFTTSVFTFHPTIKHKYEIKLITLNLGNIKFMTHSPPNHFFFVEKTSITKSICCYCLFFLNHFFLIICVWLEGRAQGLWDVQEIAKKTSNQEPRSQIGICSFTLRLHYRKPIRAYGYWTSEMWVRQTDT